MLIYKLKYDRDRLIARDLSLLLLKAYGAINDTMPDSTTAKLVPIPLSRWRMIQRGFNQAELLAKHIQQKTNVPVLTKLLLRCKHTKPQHKLNKQERAANLRDAFKCSGLKALPEETSIILVDDIHTSGSTLAQAAHERWITRASGVRSDGQSVSVTTAFTPLGKDRVLWETLERTVGGEVVPGTDQFYLVRRAPLPGK